MAKPLDFSKALSRFKRLPRLDDVWQAAIVALPHGWTTSPDAIRTGRSSRSLSARPDPPSTLPTRSVTPPMGQARRRVVARLYAAKAREEALELNRAGNFEDAQRRLQATADRIRQYAGEDHVIAQILAEMEDRHVLYGHHLSAATLKGERYASYNISRMRQADGKARRSPDAP